MSIKLKLHNEFRKFYHEFFPSVYALMRKYTGDGDVADDLAQEAFIKVYECKEEFDSMENAKAFLYTVARNLYFNYYKHEKMKEQALTVEDEDEYESSWLDEVTAVETIRLLYAAIDKLPPQTRKIILLNLQGKNNNEVAEILNISVNTVKSMKKSAYHVLRKCLNQGDLFFLFLFCDFPF